MTLTTANSSSNGVVVLDTIDDYLAPSQACINPLFQPENDVKSSDKTAATATTPAIVVPRARQRRRRVVAGVAPARKEVEEEPQVASAMTEDDENGRSLTSMNHAKEPPKQKETIQASMADCLACSGCVTTAETVLMEQHHSLNSLRQRLLALTSSSTRIWLTLSPNSLADMCRHWQLDPHVDVLKLISLLHRVLPQLFVVVDGNVPLEWTWQEEAMEFVQGYRQKQQQQQLGSQPALLPPPPSTAIDATNSMYYLADGTTRVVTNQTQISTSSGTTGSDTNDQSQDPYYAHAPNLPFISGSCPALVCLVEKSMHALVPALSRTLSPMSRMGWALLLTTNLRTQQPYQHWAVMPCHDKKLEASRKDFYDTSSGIQAVDLVITTVELVELVEEWRRTSAEQQQEEVTSMRDYLNKLPAAKLLLSPNDCSTSTMAFDSISKLLHEKLDDDKNAAVYYWTNAAVAASIDSTTVNSSSPLSTNEYKTMALASGGHADYIFRFAARELFGSVIPPQQPIEWELAGSTAVTSGKTIKSMRIATQQKKQQFYRACLYRQTDGSITQSPGPECLLQFGIVRGMQTMQRVLKELVDDDSNTTTSLDYLEAMACPHGCVNGGGSVRTTTSAAATTTATSSAVLLKETPTETKTRVDQTLHNLIVSLPISSLGTAKEEDHAAVSTKPSYRYQTRYHVVPPMHYAKGAAAGVKVQDMQW